MICRCRCLSGNYIQHNLFHERLSILQSRILANFYRFLEDYSDSKVFYGKVKSDHIFFFFFVKNDVLNFF